MKIIIKENQKKLQHLHRRIGEIEDYFDGNEELFVSVVKNLNLGGFCHAVSTYIADMLAQDVENATSNPNFDYVTFRNQVQLFIQSHFYEKMKDFYNKHKKQLNESKKDLYDLIPPNVKRRLEPGDLDDLELIIDKKYSLRGYYLSGDFEYYFNSVISDSIDSFVANNKSDMYVIGTNLDNYNTSIGKVISLFQGLIPFLKEKYRDKLYQFYSDL